MENDWHFLDVNEVLDKLNTNLKGLKSDEIIIRLERYGYNQLTASKKISPLKILIMQFKSILIIILLIATIISLVTGHGIVALVIIIIVIVSAIVGFIQEYRA